MPSTSFRYHGYTIHISDLSGSDLSGDPTVTYQSPFWPSDPRIVKAPSVDTAKRWIREECRRVAARTRKFQFLMKLTQTCRIKFGGRDYTTPTYLIVDKDGLLLTSTDLDIPAFKTVQDARDYAESQDFALFEHFNY